MRTKRVSCVFVFVLVASLGFSQGDYYYYAGEQKPLKIDEEKVCILIPHNQSYSQSKVISELVVKETFSFGAYEMKIVELPAGGGTTVGSRMTVLKNRLDQKSANSIVWPVYRSEYMDDLIFSGYVNVKLRKQEDTILLKEALKVYQLEIAETFEYMPLWYALRVSIPAKTPLEIANELYNEEFIVSSFPVFFNDVKLSTCSTDPKFGNQWGLQNNANPGIDISACEAWNLSTGKGINIAVIDVGVDRNHKDLKENIHSLSFDATSGKSPSKIYNNRNYEVDGHGTHCAGIAAAVLNNGYFGAGVAPNAKIIAVSHNFLTMATNSDLQLANAIKWSSANGVDVISCSWNGGHNDAIKEAIDEVVSQGRNGFGCVVVVSSGNNKSSSVVFPSNLENVIAVGAIDRNAKLYSKSNYGKGLSICAPGVDIYSTVPYSDAGYMTGTSMACPHVSGLVALILQVNPKLRAKDVKDIIEMTAKKIGGASYAETKENGTWDEKFGYGLIDAYSAVQKAQTYCPSFVFEDRTVSKDETVEGCNISVKNVDVKKGAKLKIEGESVIIESSFTVEEGSELEIVQPK